jgi:hypothetical protein
VDRPACARSIEHWLGGNIITWHEVRATIMNRRACNRSRAGLSTDNSYWRRANNDNQPESVRSIASYEVRATKTVGGRAIGRCLQSQSEVTW